MSQTEDWKELAACKGRHPSMFFTNRPEVIEQAKALCRTCPVACECGEAGKGEYGLWGGLTLDERTGQPQRQRNQPPKPCDFCGDPFIPYSGSSQFCPNCQMRTNNRLGKRRRPERVSLTETVCANALCSVVFMPRRSRHICCSDRCAGIYRGQKRGGGWDFSSATKRRTFSIQQDEATG